MEKVLSFSSVGKRVRLSRILKDGKAVIFAMDHGMEHGPDEFPEEHLNPKVIISKVVSAGVDAIMVNPGIARLTYEEWGNKTALIVKVTGKTVLRPKEDQFLQSPTGIVEEAIALGADAVAATIYWGTPYEDVMMERFVEIANACSIYGMPILQLAYPRGPTIQNRYDVKIVKYGARAAAEIGADLIKTYWTGSKETFSQVVKAASGIPVLLSGGARTPKPIDFLKIVEQVLEAGGSGVVVGRNVFQLKNPEAMVRALIRLVHKGESPEEAARAEGLM